MTNIPVKACERKCGFLIQMVCCIKIWSVNILGLGKKKKRVCPFCLQEAHSYDWNYSTNELMVSRIQCMLDIHFAKNNTWLKRIVCDADFNM